MPFNESKGKVMYAVPAQVKALSFDIWLTLLNGNAAFTRPRLQLIFGELGFPGLDVELLLEAYQESEQHFNDAMEDDMLDYGMDVRIERMFAFLGLPFDRPNADTLSAIQLKVGELRRRPEFAPTFIESDLPQTLQRLRDQGYTLGLLSNTGIDNEQSMEIVLRELDIWDLFQVRIFSSEDGRAKPNPDLFRRMANELQVAPNQVLHIGDNTNADYRAIEAGMNAVVYAPKGSNYPAITSLKELLNG